MAASEISIMSKKEPKTARLGGNVEAFVPTSVARALREKFHS